MKYKAVRAVAFLLIGAALFSGFFSVFCIKNAKNLERFKRLPKNTVDVLFIGSSHAFMNIDPSVLYRESGVSACVLGAGSQPLWQTYYHLKEALKTQRPKVVFVECYKVDLRKDYVKDEITVKASSGMGLSRNFFDMLNASVRKKARMADFVLRFPWFHARYKEIGPEDYLPDYGDVYYKDYLGYYALTNVVKGKIPKDLDQVTARRRISAKNLEYLDRFVALSQEAGFDLVFLVTPFWKQAAKKQGYFNTLADYAAERGVPLLNCNLAFEEIGLNRKRDFSNTSHLSVSGAEKVAKYLNDYLAARWTLPDHRGDERYAVWERNLALMERIRSDPDHWREHTGDQQAADA